MDMDCEFIGWNEMRRPMCRNSDGDYGLCGVVCGGLLLGDTKKKWRLRIRSERNHWWYSFRWPKEPGNVDRYVRMSLSKNILGWWSVKLSGEEDEVEPPPGEDAWKARKLVEEPYLIEQGEGWEKFLILLDLGLKEKNGGGSRKDGNTHLATYIKKA